MEDLKALVKDLEKEYDIDRQIGILQKIGEKLLTEYVLKIGDTVIEPLRVEAYYYPFKEKEKFDDPCAHPSSVKINNFGKLYFIEERYGYPGVDLCLSAGNYYLSFLIKNSRIGTQYFKQMDLYDRFAPHLEEIEKADILQKIDNNNKLVFTTSRIGLNKAKTKFAHSLLASVVDLSLPNSVFGEFEDGGKTGIIKRYLKEHPQVDTEAFCKVNLGWCPSELKKK